MVDILKEKYKHEPRICIICGKEYIPKRSDQRCCLDPECKKGLQRLNYKEYRETHYAKVLETNRRCMAKRREERIRERNTPKEDAIVAIGYADRQMAASLKMAGKVNTEL